MKTNTIISLKVLFIRVKKRVTFNIIKCCWTTIILRVVSTWERKGKLRVESIQFNEKQFNRSNHDHHVTKTRQLN